MIVPLASAAAMMFACGPWSVTSQTEEPARHTRVESDAPMASALDVRVADGVELALTVTNNTKRTVELEFPTGLTHDFVVLDASDKEVWRWSGGRMFTSAMQTKLMKSGRSATYHTHWHPEVLEGKYVAVAVLHATNYPVSARVPFTLP